MLQKYYSNNNNIKTLLKTQTPKRKTRSGAEIKRIKMDIKWLVLGGMNSLVWIESYWMKVNEFKSLINLTFESKINL